MNMYYRDLSWLEFNFRVLREAACEHVPLYDRIKFLSIFSSNFDEFFSIRYPAVLTLANLKRKSQKKIDSNLPDDYLASVQKEIERQFAVFGDILTRQVIPELAENNIVLYYGQALKEQHINEAREIFLSKVLSFLQPVFLNEDTLSRFEPEANKLYMIISLGKKGEDTMEHAIIKVPSDSLKRFYKLSPVNGVDHVIFIDDIIKENSRFIFPGFEIAGVYCIKFNRNEDIDFTEDYHGDILKLIEKQLSKRAHGFPSRFLFEPSMPRNVQLYVATIFGIDQDEIFTGSRYHNLSDLSSLPRFGKKLINDEWKPLSLFKLSEGGNIFKEIRRRDILLHFPYHSYNPILFFFNQAAIDPDVSDIYITLYRLASDSLIANALISAARNGKKVIVFIELKARFDEANNISWSKKMKDAGVRIIYSIPGIKVHSKIALVVLGKGEEKEAYSLISTGNFNELTARLYTDHTLLSVNQETNSELLTLFHFLEKRQKPNGVNTLAFEKLLVSQFNLTDRFEKLIQKEIENVKKKGSGLIRIKINNLEEPGMIELLYKAGQAGVNIQLIVRSICCLIPGVKGMSSNIVSKRLVDRYLEHSRIFIFGDDNEAKVFLGSADWMTKNLYYRIEVCTPVTDPFCRRELLDYFSLQWMDNDKTEVINSAEEIREGIEQTNGQLSIYNYLKNKK